MANYKTKHVELTHYVSDSATQSLQAYFGRVREGNSNVYDTPFAKGETTAQLLAAWMQELESISRPWPSLWEFEKDLAAKVGPLSIEKPLKERLVDIDNYYDDVTLSSEPVDSRATSAVLQEMRFIKDFRIREQGHTMDLMKKSSNSGLPYFTKRRNVIDQTVPATIDSDFEQVLGKEHQIWNSAAVLGWRGQEGGPTDEDVKQRVIWMFPFGVNLCELQVYQPLIELAQKHNLVPSWVSMDAVDMAITKLFDSKSSKDPVICTDFSKFDQHFNADMQDAAATILSGLLQHNPSSESWISTVFPIKYSIPLVINADSDGLVIRTGRHGMGSGSGGTNADETLAHRSLQYEAALAAGKTLNPYSQCLGDDGILSYPGITVDNVVDMYSSHGQEMNPDKQYVSTQDCVYLRRWHHQQYRMNGVCVGVYSTCRALGRLRYLERFMNPKVWDAKAVALRQLSILENCKYHPLREQFVQFCMKRDKYRLGVDIPHFFDDLLKIAQEKIDLMPDFLGYTKTLQGEGISGIQNWWVVKYLQSLR